MIALTGGPLMAFSAHVWLQAEILRDAKTLFICFVCIVFSMVRAYVCDVDAAHGGRVVGPGVARLSVTKRVICHAAHGLPAQHAAIKAGHHANAVAALTLKG